MRREFSAVREHCPPEKLFATRYSLLAAVLPVANRQSPFAVVRARQETRPPISFRPPSLVPRPSSHSKSALSFSVINYGPKSVAWFVFSTLWDY